MTAYVEGWALYTERLADEMGLYSGDLDRMGMLTFDAWRACRLVVDTGLHAMGWSRQQAIDYMLENTALAENNIENEVDRYIAWPGQALAYKLGQLEILRLRHEAEQRLGPRFDIRALPRRRARERRRRAAGAARAGRGVDRGDGSSEVKNDGRSPFCRDEYPAANDSRRQLMGRTASLRSALLVIASTSVIPVIAVAGGNVGVYATRIQPHGQDAEKYSRVSWAEASRPSCRFPRRTTCLHSREGPS